jgi:hypothetical protein
MDVPHTLSAASLLPIAPELLGHGEDMSDIHPDLATATATVLANQVNLDNTGDNADDSSSILLDHGIAGHKWNVFAAGPTDYYQQGMGTDQYEDEDDNDNHIDPTLDINQQNVDGAEQPKLNMADISQVEGIEGAEGGDGGEGGEGGEGSNQLTADEDQQTGSPAIENTDQDPAPTGNKRKRARRDPSTAGPSVRKRASAVQDPNDPHAHLLLPVNLQGRSIEYSTAPLEDTRHGPVYIHPPQGTVQACVRCHGIKRKCEALVWRLRTETDVVGDASFESGSANMFHLHGAGAGSIIWEKPRCSGCDKADVPCVFELGAASSG